MFQKLAIANVCPNLTWFKFANLYYLKNLDTKTLTVLQYINQELIAIIQVKINQKRQISSDKNSNTLIMGMHCSDIYSRLDCFTRSMGPGVLPLLRLKFPAAS